MGLFAEIGYIAACHLVDENGVFQTRSHKISLHIFCSKIDYRLV